MELEYSLLKAPFEITNKQFRNSQKLIEKEISAVITNIQDLEKKKETFSKQDAFQQIDKLATKLQGLKRKVKTYLFANLCKVEEMRREDEKEFRKFKIRTQHLKSSTDLDLKKLKQVECIQWNEIRVNRIIEDYLLRSGYLQTASAFAVDANILELVDIDIFIAGKKVLDGLENKDCKEALKWCNDNKSKLKKMECDFEFELRIQETIEFIRSNKSLEAIQYARKYLAPSAFISSLNTKTQANHNSNENISINSQTTTTTTVNIKKIQQVMTAIALFPNHLCSNYQDLFSDQRWKELQVKFKTVLQDVHSLPLCSLLNINGQSGLIALKSSYCNEIENSNINCPTCVPTIRMLSKELPFALHAHTTLICRISGDIMTDDNPPMILPNGFAYSKNVSPSFDSSKVQALTEMAVRNNSMIACPRSHQTFSSSELRRAFII